MRDWVLSVLALDDDARVDKLNEDVLANARQWDVSRVRHVTEVLMTWYRDVLSLKHGRPESEIANQDSLAALRREADALTIEDLGRRVREVDGLVTTVEGQVTPSLALFSAFMRLSAGTEQLLLGER